MRHLENLRDSDRDDLFLGFGVAGPPHEVEDGPDDVLHLLAADVPVAVLADVRCSSSVTSSTLFFRTLEAETCTFFASLGNENDIRKGEIDIECSVAIPLKRINEMDYFSVSIRVYYLESPTATAM